MERGTANAEAVRRALTHPHGFCISFAVYPFGFTCLVFTVRGARLDNDCHSSTQGHHHANREPHKCDARQEASSEMSYCVFHREFRATNCQRAKTEPRIVRLPFPKVNLPSLHVDQYRAISDEKPRMSPRFALKQGFRFALGLYYVVVEERGRCPNHIFASER